MSDLQLQINTTIDQWIDMANTLNFQLLLRKPADESWSLGQVAMHLDAETKFYIQQVETCLKSIDNRNESMTDDARRMFEANGFPSIRIKRDDSLSSYYPQPDSKEDLVGRLVTLKQQLNKLVSKIDVNEESGKTRHPGLGYFNAKQWVQFAEMHMRHHLNQKVRIEKELSNHLP